MSDLIDKQAVIDDYLRMKKIKLTPRKIGLGVVSKPHKLVNYDYTIQNNFSVYITDEARKENSALFGRYESWAFMNVPNRKRKVHVFIGFDEYGNYYKSSIDYNDSKLPLEMQIQLLNTLSEWLIADGWAEQI